MILNPKYPVYIVSKGRYESRLTSKALEKINVPYSIVIEPQEYQQYSAVIDPSKILQLPFSNLGQGSIPARNWIWEHSMERGYDFHWILDDNIRWFARVNKNKKTILNNGVCFNIVEDFVGRYENIALSGFQYEMFVSMIQKYQPFLLNTRIYSYILVRNDLPFRWRGKYNEDTDLSLRVLKAGWCTVLVQAFICKKMATMTMKGGNTESLYLLNNGQDGRLLMAQVLQKLHPDVIKITKKWGRWQHQVDYSKFRRRNKLIRKKDVVIPKGMNNYGLKLKKIDK